MSLTQAVKAEALRLGFMACGVCRPDPSAHAEFLDQWLARGFAGNMRYLHRQARKRKQPRLYETHARSIVVVLDNYYDGSDVDTERKIARYARRADYHKVIGRRLGALTAFLRERGALVARASIDSGPIPERELAQRAGLGWIGKNTMLIRPATGAYCFIGSVFTDLPLQADQPFTADHCGTCNRCLEACPTGALVEARMLDARRCISYLTIEYAGTIPDELSGQFEGWAFGCDICNEVCPWNIRFAGDTPPPVSELAARPDFVGDQPDFFDRMSPEDFDRRFGDTPLERAGLMGMRRNWSLGRDRGTP